MTSSKHAVLGLGAILALAACTSQTPLQADVTKGTVGSLPAVTPPTPVLTVTETVTATMTPTVTVSVPGQASATALPTAPSIPAVFDETAAQRAARAVVADMRRLDVDFAGTPSASALGVAAQDLRALDSHLRELLAAGVPTSTDGPSYVARILSLRTFVSAATGETRADPVRAKARYGVIRTETAVLLTQVGTGTGETITLPPSAPAR